MRIAIFGAGSQGDIQPCLRLGRRLQQAGAPVLLAAPQNFADLAGEAACPFMPCAAMSSRSWLARPARATWNPAALQMGEDALEAGSDADALITLAVFAPLGQTIAEICKIPLLLIEPTPVLPTGDFPAPGWPMQRNLGRRFSPRPGLRAVAGRLQLGSDPPAQGAPCTLTCASLYLPRSLASSTVPASSSARDAPTWGRLCRPAPQADAHAPTAVPR